MRPLVKHYISNNVLVQTALFSYTFSLHFTGDLIALSVSTPEHLNKIGLLSAEVTEESLLNYQMQMGLDKV